MLTDDVIGAIQATSSPQKLFDAKSLYLLSRREAVGCGDSSIAFRRVAQATRKS